MLTDRKISVVIPCFNDAGSVREMYRRVTTVMAGITPQYEFVYVNDASPDDAMEVLREIAHRDPRFVVIDHSRNFGVEAAYTAGLSICTGDAAILIDGDLQDPPELFPDLVRKWLDGYDVVYGVRRRRQGNIVKRICYKLFYRIFRGLSYVDIPLDAGDFGLIDRRVITILNSLPETDRFLRGLRAWVGFKSTGVPYVRGKRFAGKSASGLTVYLRGAARGIFSFSYVPLEMVSYLAVFMSGLSLIAVVFYVFLALFYRAPRGFLTLLVLPLILSSMQFLCLAVIAQYVGRTFAESKRRPLYVIKDILNDPRPTSEGRR